MVYLLVFSILVIGGISNVLTVDDNMKKIASASNEFGINLYNTIAELDKNMVYSPYSIFVVMSMVMAGAKTNTKTQLKDVLKVASYDDTFIYSNIKLLNDLLQADNVTSVAQGLFLKEGSEILQSYMDIVQNYYDSETQETQFENPGRDLINNWIDQKTKGLIKNMIPEGVLNEDTFSVLVNTIYFKHTWKNQFIKEKTKSHEFAMLGEFELSATGAVKMMEGEFKIPRGVVNLDGVEMEFVSLPYHKEDELKSNYRMTIIKPKFNKKDYFLKAENVIGKNANNFFDVLKLKEKYEKVHIKIPKFTVEYSKGIVPPLKQMGLLDLFDDNKADLTGITDQVSLVVTDILHKAKAIIDEEGTEAAAATAVVFGTTSIPKPEEPKPFYCHRPFLYYITHTDSNLILFQGKVLFPEESKDPIEVKISSYYTPDVQNWTEFFFEILTIPIIVIVICLFIILIGSAVLVTLYFIKKKKTNSKNVKELKETLI